MKLPVWLKPRSDFRALRAFGVALAVTHLVTAWFWTGFHFDHLSVCWAFWPECTSWQRALGAHYSLLLATYAAVGVFSASLFLFAPWRFSRGLFAGLCVFKLLIQLTDYRMMGNYHYMSHIMGLSLAFLPEIESLSRLWLVLFYFSAGWLKFNGEWLSGSALLNVPWVTGKPLELALAWAILLETVLIFALLRRRRDVLFYWVLVQVIVFHFISWHIVGYFYPVMMLLMLSAFFIFRSPFRWPSTWINRFCISIFILAQLIPFVLEPDSSLTGRWRILSLNMLDGRTECRTRFMLHFKDSTVEYMPNFSLFGYRIGCDPAVVLDRLKKTCKDQAHFSGFQDIDVVHQVRRSSEAQFVAQWLIKKGCSSPPRMNAIGAIDSVVETYSREHSL